MSSQSKKWVNVFLVGLFLYALTGEALHFFNHFFPGLALGFLILSLLLLLGKRLTTKYEFALPFATYLYAIVPEFIFIVRNTAAKEAVHAPWEDVFLFHVTLDHALEKTELVLPATAVILYITIAIYVKIKNKRMSNNYE